MTIADSQSTTVETGNQVRQTLSLDTKVWCKNVVPNSQSRRNDQVVRSVQEGGQTRSELSHVDDDFRGLDIDFPPSSSIPGTYRLETVFALAGTLSSFLKDRKQHRLNEDEQKNQMCVECISPLSP